MTRKLTAHSLLVTLGFLASSSAVIVAHHGTSGVYDYTHRITTKATVTKYVWANPHVQIIFTLKNDKGEEQTWGVETVSPGNALANGWTKNTFKAGDQLLVSFIPALGDRFFWELSSNRVRCRWQAVGWQGHLRRRRSGGGRDEHTPGKARLHEG
jgi:hypothetical protein